MLFPYYIIESDLAVSPLLGPVRTKIMNILENGERSVSFLAESIGINKTAVKEHMDSLERMGYVESFFKREGAGRPSKYYQISKSGMELLPKKYSDVMIALLEEFTKEFGEMKLNLILGRVADKMIENAGFKDSRGLITERDKKLERLHGFVDALNKLGYYARMEVNGETVRIIRHNCIFYEMAKNNTRVICDVLGKDLIQKSGQNHFTMVEKFSDGGNKCIVEVDLNEKD